MKKVGLQLLQMECGQLGELGQAAVSPVEEERKPEPGPVQTLHQPMVAVTVWDQQHRTTPATLRVVLVSDISAEKIQDFSH